MIYRFLPDHSDRLREGGHDVVPIARHRAWRSFVRQMRTRQYGCEATVTAWAWFRAGWDAAGNS